MRRRIYLITESQNDIKVAKAFLETRTSTFQIVPRTKSDNPGGISRLAIELKTTLESAMREAKRGDCIIVLHDDDLHTQPDRQHYDKIRQICQQHKGAIHLVAKDEIEAWLLADSGVCAWLGVKPQNRDGDRRPSDDLNTLVKKKTGKDHTGTTRDEVLKHVSGECLSPSFQAAIAHLDTPACRAGDQE